MRSLIDAVLESQDRSRELEECLRRERSFKGREKRAYRYKSQATAEQKAEANRINGQKAWKNPRCKFCGAWKPQHGLDCLTLK